MTKLGELFSPSFARLGKKSLYEEGAPIKFILTQDEKYVRDKENVKKIFRYYESIGHSQCNAKNKEVRKLYNNAYGVLDIEDYVEIDEDFSQAQGIPKLEDLKLKFYPIIPTIVRGILGSYDKMYSEYTAQAVNPEATNDLLRQLDDGLKNALFNNLEQLFKMETQGMPVDMVEQRRKFLMESEQVRDFKNVTYRSVAEDWAIHQMHIEDEMFRTKDMERRLLEQQVVTEDPTVHIDFDGNKYRPEILLEKDTFCLRSPSSRDYSDSLMFGWFDYCTFSDILNRYGSTMKTADIEKVSGWTQSWQGETFVVNDLSQPFTKGQRYQESKHNFLTADSVIKHHQRMDMMTESGLSGEYVKLTTEYFYLPRKYGELTVRSGGTLIPAIVDESFKVTLKPVYADGMPRTADNLISGEHVEWFYKPELWRGKKVTAWGFVPDGMADYGDSEVWIELDRFDIQYSDPYETNGLYIPVHGGPITNQFNDNASTVKIAAPWQEMFNWLQNRNKQLMATEIGKFFALSETSIPNESLDGEWGRYALENFMMNARDTHLAPIANPLTAGGNPSLGMQGGIGQTIDLTNTQDILNKFTLAALIETSCYQSIGLTREFLLGDFSPQQTAKTAAMGQQRTATQLQNLLTRVTEVMVRTRTTMLTAAHFLAQRNPTVQMSYTHPQQGRIIFRGSTEDFPLYRLGVFCKSNGGDLSTIESIKNYVAGNNTMGADSFEMATLMSFKSIPELFKNLKKIQDKKEEQRLQQQEHERTMQEQQLAAIQQKVEVELAAESNEKALDRDMQVMVAQIKTLGYAEGTAADISREILALQTANDRQKELYDRAELARRQQDTREKQTDMSFEAKQKEQSLRERVAMKTIEQKDEELRLREKEIEARNKRTSAID